MTIQVQYLGMAVKSLGKGKDSVDAPGGALHVRELLAELDRRSGGRLFADLRVDPEMKEIPAFFGVYVNGRNYHMLAGLDTVVADGDAVVVGTLLAGG